MKFCQTHWDKLKEAIREAGIYGFAASSSDQIAAKMVKEIDAGASKSTFDPLMNGYLAILSNALDAAGLQVMGPNEDGSDRCPLCFMNEAHRALCKDGPGCTFSYDPWIGFAARDQREKAVELGLMASDAPKVST